MTEISDAPNTDGSGNTDGPVPQPVSPSELVDMLAPALAHGVIGFDVDGVLAPIVHHADESQLHPGAGDALDRLAQRTSVIIVSGRSLESLERLFGFSPKIHVVGSHGLEVRGEAHLVLDPDEQYTFDQLHLLGTKAVEAAGSGAWLEIKPASVVLHTRQADPVVGERAVAALTNLAGMVDGTQIKRGHSVVELLARAASKGDALLRFARDTGRAPIAYLGDDITDEDAFVKMAATDVSVRVGPGDTAARFRLDDAEAAAEVVRLIGQ